MFSIDHQSMSIDHFWSIGQGGYNRLKPPLVSTAQPWFLCLFEVIKVIHFELILSCMYI